MNILKIFSDYRHIQIFILSIFSAMPLGILYKAVPAWLSDAQIGIAVITTFSVAKIFYSLKFQVSCQTTVAELMALGDMFQMHDTD